MLANFALCDTLLRLAEFPELYEPRWSEEIMAETVRTLEAKLGWPRSLTESLQKELRTHFAEAWVSGYEPLVSEMTNDPKDRHVAAVAVHCKAEAVVTFNLRHFRPEHLLAWNISAIHPDDFLIALYHRNPDLVTAKLQEQAKDRRRLLSQLCQILRPLVPNFVASVQHKGPITQSE